ncbi:MAG: DUF3299 domain-containing protein [Pseudomonadota bacterium]
MRTLALFSLLGALGVVVGAVGVTSGLIGFGASQATPVIAAAPTPGSRRLMPAQDIEWENLQPELPEDYEPEPQAPIDHSIGTEMFLSDAQLFNDIPESEEDAIRELAAMLPPQPIEPTVDTYNGKRIRLAGYMVPLDFQATKVSEFLLVPYVGACIHVPAPATNQVVYIQTDNPVEFTGLYDPVYVTGTMSTESEKTELAEAGYRIRADDVRPYE